MPKAAGVADVSHNACHLLGQGCGLHCTQHLPTLAATPACVGHNTSHLHRPKHLFTSAKTLVYVGQCCDLHWPQHLSFTSAKTSHNTGLLH